MSPKTNSSTSYPSSDDQSAELIKQAIRSTISLITYECNFFDPTAFTTTSSSSSSSSSLSSSSISTSTTLESLPSLFPPTSTSMSWEVQSLVSWLENGVFPSLDARVLKKLIFAVYCTEAADEPSTTTNTTTTNPRLDTYEFIITYNDNNNDTPYTKNPKNAQSSAMPILRNIVSYHASSSPQPFSSSASSSASSSSSRFLTIEIECYSKPRPPSIQPSAPPPPIPQSQPQSQPLPQSALKMNNPNQAQAQAQTRNQAVAVHLSPNFSPPSSLSSLSSPIITSTTLGQYTVDGHTLSLCVSRRSPTVEVCDLFERIAFTSPGGLLSKKMRRTGSSLDSHDDDDGDDDDVVARNIERANNIANHKHQTLASLSSPININKNIKNNMNNNTLASPNPASSSTERRGSNYKKSESPTDSLASEATTLVFGSQSPRTPINNDVNSNTNADSNSNSSMGTKMSGNSSSGGFRNT